MAYKNLKYRNNFTYCDENHTQSKAKYNFSSPLLATRSLDLFFIWILQIEEEHRIREEAEKQAQSAERRAAMIQGEVDDYRSQCEQVERTYKMQAAELVEANDRVSELTGQSSSLNAHKKRLETTVQQMQSDLEAQVCTIKLKKSLINLLLLFIIYC